MATNQRDKDKTMKAKYLVTNFFIFLISFHCVASEVTVREIPRPKNEGPWPEFEVITTIKASPLEAVAIYYALDYQKDYVPNVIKSDVIDQPSPLEAVTSYEFNTPWPLPNSTYTNGSKLQKLNNGAYQVSWWFIKNSAANNVYGSATFLPHPKGSQLIYRSYIAPKSFLAGFFKSTASADIAKTIQAIKEHIESLREKQSPILTKYKQLIIDALENKFTYKEF